MLNIKLDNKLEKICSNTQKSDTLFTMSVYSRYILLVVDLLLF